MKLKLKKETVFLCALFSAHIVMGRNGVISAYSGGRLGDNLLAFSQALYFSLKNDFTMYLVPFDYSNELVLDGQISRYTENIEKKFKKKMKFHPQSRYAENDVLVPRATKDENTLFVVSYFADVPVEYFYFQNWKSWSRFFIDWEDAMFKKKLRSLIRPKKEIECINPPQDKISVAVHLRRGGGFDNPNHVHLGLHIHKAPYDSYYINQIKAIAQLFPHKPIYVYLFTDEKNPLEIMEKYESALDNAFLEFACRRTDNFHNTNVLEDFFSLMNFDILIRSESNFSIMAEKLGDHKIIISPGDFFPSTKVHLGKTVLKKNWENLLAK